MSQASEWVELVEEVAAQEPPRFQGSTITQARVAPNGSMRLQLQGAAVEVPAQEALALGQWIDATFNSVDASALATTAALHVELTGTLT